MDSYAHLAPEGPAIDPGALPDVGFSTNVLNHPRNRHQPPGEVGAAVDFLGRHFRSVEIEISEDAQAAIFGATPAGYDRIVEEVRAAASRHGLRLSVHAAWFGDHTNISAADPAEREASIALLRRSLRFAHDVGARPVSFHPGYHEGQPRERFVENLERSLEVILPEAEALGLSMCLENMGDDRPSYIVLDEAEQVDLCRRTGLRIALDVIHLRSIHEEEGAFFGALEELAPHVGNVHIADMRGASHAHLPIGDGDYPLTRVLQRLGAHGYRGGAIVEEFVRSREFDVFLERAQAYREWLGARPARAA